MTWSIILATAKPWTYWLAPALLVAAMLAAVAIAVGYYRHVAVPAARSRMAEQRRRLAELRRSHGTVVAMPQLNDGAGSPMAA